MVRHAAARRWIATLVAISTVTIVDRPANAQDDAPRIARNGSAQQLYVNGKPFIILGGEPFNSAASSPHSLAKAFDRLKSAHGNTILAPVSWDQFEPREGAFDFTMIDAILAQAREREMHVTLLWFGAFKNARSTYAPTWVRANRRRFPRAQTTERDEPSGALPETLAPVLSAFTPALWKADARAFAALLHHVAAVDHDHRVIMVQVENEVGLLGDSRDRSSGAQAAWDAPVPRALIAYLQAHRDTLPARIRDCWQKQGARTSGSWAQMFGTDKVADEIFSAWAFASYVERVARAGKTELPVPLYANTWLGPEPGQTEPGQYPSGGPVAAMIDIWKAAAPSLSLVAPDIYVPDEKAVQARYSRPDNPLFIPEAKLLPGDMFWALGQHDAIGRAPFGYDKLREDSQFKEAYGLIAPMLDEIANAQAEGRVAGILVEGDEVQKVRMNGYTFTIRGSDAFWRQRRLDAGQKAPPPPPPPPPSEVSDVFVSPDTRPFGMIIGMKDGSFLMLGQGYLIDVTRDGKPVEIDRIVEGRYVDGTWQPGRWLNGDEYGMVVPRDHIGATRLYLLTR